MQDSSHHTNSDKIKYKSTRPRPLKEFCCWKFIHLFLWNNTFDMKFNTRSNVGSIKMYDMTSDMNFRYEFIWSFCLLTLFVILNAVRTDDYTIKTSPDYSYCCITFSWNWRVIVIGDTLVPLPVQCPSECYNIGPSVAVEAVLQNRETQWPLNSLSFSLLSLWATSSTRHIVHLDFNPGLQYRVIKSKWYKLNG